MQMDEKSKFKMQNSKVRTRIAPSPTGFPHIGTVYQALFNYSFAKKNKGSFLVRIEDTDQARFVEGAENKIFEALDWFGLSEDESPRKEGKYGPYRQSERLGIYKEYVTELVEKGGAYYCFCTNERLDVLRSPQQASNQAVMYDRTCRSLNLEDTKKRLNEKHRHLRFPSTFHSSFFFQKEKSSPKRNDLALIYLKKIQGFRI